jgi:hypothetical protein
MLSCSSMFEVVVGSAHPTVLDVRGGGGQCPPYGSRCSRWWWAVPTLRFDGGWWWAVPTLRFDGGDGGPCPPYASPRWGIAHRLNRKFMIRGGGAKPILTDQKPSAYDWLSILPTGYCRRLSAKRPQGVTGGSFHMIFTFYSNCFKPDMHQGPRIRPGTLVSILLRQ